MSLCRRIEWRQWLEVRGMRLENALAGAADWAEFGFAMLLFLGSHVFAAMPRLRNAAIEKLGAVPYRTLYSLLSMALLVWLIRAAARAPYIPLWEIAEWQFLVPHLAMPVVCLLIAFGTAVPNPFSLGGRKAGFAPQSPGIAGFSRHPLLWGLAIWAMAHLFPNGDLAHVILFGLFASYAIAGTIMFDRRRQKEMGLVAWQLRAAHTSNFPGVAFCTGRWRPRLSALNPIRLGTAALFYVALLALHQQVIGVSPWAFG
jgi:uncharacterized membrane protein